MCKSDDSICEFFYVNELFRGGGMVSGRRNIIISTIVGFHNISIDDSFNLFYLSWWSILPTKNASNPIYEKRAAYEF